MTLGCECECECMSVSVSVWLSCELFSSPFSFDPRPFCFQVSLALLQLCLL